MTFQLSPYTNALVNHAAQMGLFERINKHEPKPGPGNGLTYAIWVQDFGPQPAESGMAATTMRLVMNGRVFQNFLSEPVDSIDERTIDAVGALMEAYSLNFTLGGLVKSVDLLGRNGSPLSSQAGYINYQGNTYRVMTINIPLVINDTFGQEA